ncbi:MAG: phosphotransferase [Alphaproteobacteria bacterium]|nr:phosphotransferase [Alphaproteobacteria bacterium]
MSAAVLDEIEAALGLRPLRATPLSGGSIAAVWRLDMTSGEALVAKTGPAGAGLEREGRMLDYLRDRTALPAPRTLHAADRLLVMTHVAAGDVIDAAAERHAAELLAALHGIHAPRFGMAFDTPLGGLAQPNGWMESWRAFFRDRRLMPMAQAGLEAGRLPAPLMARIERLCGRLDSRIAEDAPPSLIHGDIWGGNVLVRQGRIAAFVDPALYYADAEIELAFATLFSTFGEAFFARYGELRPLRPGFFEERRDLYNLYPALVHVRLFGGGYAGMVDRLLSRCGV